MAEHEPQVGRPVGSNALPTEEKVQLRERGLALFARYEASPLHNDAMLREATTLLARAFVGGDYIPETVWTLTRALRYAADLERIIAVLKAYANHAPNVQQEFMARHAIADHYALLRRDAEAVVLHTDLLNRMRDLIPPASLLQSCANTTMLRSWRAAGATDAWIALTSDLYASIDDNYATCVARAEYLRTLAEAIYIPDNDVERAAETCATLLALTQRYDAAWAEARWTRIDVRGILLSLYHNSRQDEREAQALEDGLRELGEYEGWIEQQIDEAANLTDVPRDLMMHQMFYQFALHNFACQCLWSGHYHQAVALLERSLLINDVPETHFFLAAALLKSQRDYERSLDHFRRALQNPTFSRRHELRLAFEEERAFEEVWSDERYRAVIEEEEGKMTG